MGVKEAFALFFLITLSSVFAQEELKVRVRQLEEQVRQLSTELTNLHKVLYSQERVIEDLNKKIDKKQKSPYDDIIAEFQQDYKERESAWYYLKLINSHLQIGGYAEVTVEAQEGDNEQADFSLSRLALRFRSKLSDYFFFHSEIALENTEEFEIPYAYLALTLNPVVNFKAGVILVPLGHYNTFYDPPIQQLTSIPLVDQHIIPTVWGDPGFSVFGTLQLPYASLSYEALISNGLGEGGFSFIRGNRDARQGVDGDNNSNKQVSGRLELIPKIPVQVFTFVLGISGVIGEFDNNSNNEYHAVAMDGNLKIGEFSLIGDHDYLEIFGEYTRFSIERDRRILQLFPDTTNEMTGYYIQANYIFFPESWRYLKLPLLGEESNFAFSFRYENIDLATNQRGASQLDDTRIYTMGFNFRPIKKTVFKIEYNWIHEFINGDRAWNNRVLASLATYF